MAAFFSDQFIVDLSESLNSEYSYTEACRIASADPELFWGALGRHYLDWIRPYNSVMSTASEDAGQLNWFSDGTLNIADNCLDRHLRLGRGDQLALIWESEEGSKCTYTYSQLLEQVNIVSRALIDSGIKAGDVVAIFMPLLPEALIAVLACNRIGAIPCTLYSGLSGQALGARLEQSRAKLIICANATWRAGKSIDLRSKVINAISLLKAPISCVEFKRVPQEYDPQPGWLDWHNWVEDRSSSAQSVEMPASSTAFMIHTSGTTGCPKQVEHQLAGALLACHMTTRWCFNAHPGDVLWSTSDLGWIASMSHVIYGPLSNGLTTLIFEGSIVTPGQNHVWSIIERYRVAKWKTAPTAIRSLMRDNPNPQNDFNLTSLDVVFSSGEPLDISSRAWIVNKVLPPRGTVVDGWGQTETCSTMICSIPGSELVMQGSVGRPLPGAQFAILSSDHEVLSAGIDGYLQVQAPWPGLWREMGTPSPNDPLSTGDVARLAADGSYRIVGRHDDVVNVSGHRISTTEVEEAIKRHSAISEVAAVGRPHEIKGQCIATFVTLAAAVKDPDVIELEVHRMVADYLGPYAAPTDIFVVPELPRTHSGKIAKGYLMKLAAQEHLESSIDSSMIQNTSILAELESESLNRDNYA